MRMMKKRSIVLKRILGVLISLIGVIVLFSSCNSRALQEYEYVYDQNDIEGGNLIMDEVIYTQITEAQYESIFDHSESENLDYYENSVIGKFDLVYILKYSGERTEEYRILGNMNSKDRILLKCDDLRVKFDVRNPVLYFCRQDILYPHLDLTEYKHVGDGKTIEGAGVIYIEINEETFQWIYDVFKEQNIYIQGGQIVGRINNNYEDEWKYILYGLEVQKERILLKGKEKQAFYDKNYPRIYFCREDILNLFEEHGTFEDIDLREYME